MSRLRPLLFVIVALWRPASAQDEPADDGYGGYASEVATGLAGRPVRVPTPAGTLVPSRRRGGASAGGHVPAPASAVTYAYQYTFMNPDNAHVTHFSCNTTLVDEVWADGEPSLQDVACSWPPGAPAKDAVYVELSYATASDNRVSNGSLIFG